MFGCIGCGTLCCRIFWRKLISFKQDKLKRCSNEHLFLLWFLDVRNLRIKTKLHHSSFLAYFLSFVNYVWLQNGRFLMSANRIWLQNGRFLMSANCIWLQNGYFLMFVNCIWLQNGCFLMFVNCIWLQNGRFYLNQVSVWDIRYLLCILLILAIKPSFRVEFCKNFVSRKRF